MNISLFFGSFNPIHIGHLIIAEAMLNKGCDEVWFMVSPQNPLKELNGLVDEYQRYIMCKLAVGKNERIKVSDFEFNLPKPSYTIDTLARLVVEYPDYNFSLLLGSDNLDKFKLWKDYEKILERFNLNVYLRPGYNLEAVDIKYEIIDAPIMDISATKIRAMLKEKQSIKYLVNDEVIDWIKSNKLYE